MKITQSLHTQKEYVVGRKPSGEIGCTVVVLGVGDYPLPPIYPQRGFGTGDGGRGSIHLAAAILADHWEVLPEVVRREWRRQPSKPSLDKLPQAKPSPDKLPQVAMATMARITLAWNRGFRERFIAPRQLEPDGYYTIDSDEIGKWIEEDMRAQVQKVVKEGSEEQFIELLRGMDQIARELATADDAPKASSGFSLAEYYIYLRLKDAAEGKKGTVN